MSLFKRLSIALFKNNPDHRLDYVIDNYLDITEILCTRIKIPELVDNKGKKISLHNIIDNLEYIKQTIDEEFNKSIDNKYAIHKTIKEDYLISFVTNTSILKVDFQKDIRKMFILYRDVKKMVSKLDNSKAVNHYNSTFFNLYIIIEDIVSIIYNDII